MSSARSSIASSMDAVNKRPNRERPAVALAAAVSTADALTVASM